MTQPAMRTNIKPTKANFKLNPTVKVGKGRLNSVDLDNLGMILM